MSEFRVGVVRDLMALTEDGGTLWFLHCGRPAAMERLSDVSLRLRCRRCDHVLYVPERSAERMWSRGVDDFWRRAGDPHPVGFLLGLGITPRRDLWPSWRR